MRSKGSAQELENRRRLAVQRVHDGYSTTAVARFLAVHPRSVQRWLAAERADGPRALHAKPHPGRKPKLTFDQELQVVSWFDAPATAFGFANDLWTAPRTAHLIRRRFGVSFHPRYLNAWLTDRGITPQKPQRIPQERDQHAIDRWLTEDWPRIKKKAAEDKAHLVLIDETGVLMAPLVHRTLAPRGRTPTQRQRGRHRQKVSVIAALSLSPVRRQPGLYFRSFPDCYIRNTEVAAFVRQLLRHLRGRVIIVWDRGPMHRGPAIRRLLADHPRLTVESLPPYAPDLNPVEALWKHLKYDELANYFPSGVHGLAAMVHAELEVTGADTAKLLSFWNTSELGTSSNATIAA